MPKINNKNVRALRRTRAEEAQKKYNALSYEEKVELLDSRRGNSTRERTRLAEAQTV